MQCKVTANRVQTTSAGYRQLFCTAIYHLWLFQCNTDLIIIVMIAMAHTKLDFTEKVRILARDTLCRPFAYRLIRPFLSQHQYFCGDSRITTPTGQ